MTDLRGDHQLSMLDAESDLAFRMKTTCKAAHFPCRLLAMLRCLPTKRPKTTGILARFLDIFMRNVQRIQVQTDDNDKNPLVPTGIAESDSEVKVVFDETANLRILTSGKDRSDKGYGTNSLLEQWRDSYPDNDDYDPYDDDMYENHDLSEHLQSICDDLDITVRGRKKK
ncbi:hypothetical protein Tco_1482920 [Tanacetum coccineum]